MPEKQREWRPHKKLPPEPRRHAAAPPAAQSAAAPKFAVGDRVAHTAFGTGEIVKLTPMGGDALIEISFERADVGTKRLMLRAAAQHMRKAD